MTAVGTITRAGAMTIVEAITRARTIMRVPSLVVSFKLQGNWAGLRRAGGPCPPPP